MAADAICEFEIVPSAAPASAFRAWRREIAMMWNPNRKGKG
jgi:hypothetical protein